MLVLLTTMTAIYAAQDQGVADGEAGIQLRCLSEFSNLAEALAEQYQQEYPGVSIQVSGIAADNIDEFLSSGGVVLLDKACLSTLASGSELKMVVGRDVIVPVMNSSNPHVELISQNGISPQQFASIYRADGSMRWGDLLGTDDKRSVEAYIPQSSCAIAYLADFMGTAPEELLAVQVSEPVEMIRKIRANTSAIGFCTLASLVEMEEEGEDSGISIVPIDMDGDGSLESFESIYGSYAELSHGIFVGKYPRELYSKLYALSSSLPATEHETAFLEWMITGGQQSFVSAGILSIDYGERASGLRKLHPESGVVADIPVEASAGRALRLVLAGLAALALLAWLVIGRFGKTQLAGGLRNSEPGLLGTDQAAFPAGLFFDRSHTWTFMEKNGNVRIGLDDFIQRVTGSVSRVVIKSPGDQIKRGEALCTIVQHGKKLVIKSPISGVVVEQNEGLLEDASLLNTDPYAAGWICMVEPANWMSEMKSYFIGEPYGVWLKTEFTRLKDFFAVGLRDKSSRNLVPVMQDGGEIRDGVLEDLGPELWEEFQSKFINCK